VDLLELVGQPLLAAELVFVEGEDELLVVLDGVLVQLVQGAVQVELVGVETRLFGEHGIHVLQKRNTKLRIKKTVFYLQWLDSKLPFNNVCILKLLIHYYLKYTWLNEFTIQLEFIFQVY
jgi:hypothetical protein